MESLAYMSNKTPWNIKRFDWNNEKYLNFQIIVVFVNDVNTPVSHDESASQNMREGRIAREKSTTPLFGTFRATSQGEQRPATSPLQ